MVEAKIFRSSKLTCSWDRLVWDLLVCTSQFVGSANEWIFIAINWPQLTIANVFRKVQWDFIQMFKFLLNLQVLQISLTSKR